MNGDALMAGLLFFRWLGHRGIEARNICQKAGHGWECCEHARDLERKYDALEDRVEVREGIDHMIIALPLVFYHK